MLYQIHSLIGFVFLTVAFCKWVYEKTDLLIAAALFYSMMSALYLFANPNEVWGTLQGRIDSSSALTFIHIILVTFLAIRLSEADRILSLKIISAITLIDCFLVLKYGFGIYNASSHDTAVIAMTLPVIMFSFTGWIRWFAFALVLAAVVGTAGGATAYFVLAGAAGGYLLVKKKWLTIAAMAVIILGIGYLREGNSLVQSSDRFSQWEALMQWWSINSNLFFGTGTGSFDWLSPMIQGPDRLKSGESGFFLMMHNEYLQVLFEQGIIGFILFGAVWVRAMWRSIDRPWLFSAMSATSVCFLTQFPLRFFLSQFLIALLVMESEEVFYEGSNR